MNLKEYFDSLPDKLNTVLSFDKISLSAGQKQLVCLARAMLNDSKIVMMDEATANVDQQTDKFIQKMVRECFKNSSLIVIAHRLRTIIKSDVIVVMEEGSCKEMGSPRELANDKNSLLYNYITHSGVEEAEYLLKKLNKG